jgi:hypothetical protein
MAPVAKSVIGISSVSWLVDGEVADEGVGIVGETAILKAFYYCIFVKNNSAA